MTPLKRINTFTDISNEEIVMLLAEEGEMTADDIIECCGRDIHVRPGYRNQFRRQLGELRRARERQWGTGWISMRARGPDTVYFLTAGAKKFIKEEVNDQEQRRTPDGAARPARQAA